MAARPIWSGSISFALVNIPVKLFTAVREHDIHFHMLSEDGKCRLRRKLVCPETGKEYDYQHTRRGYEVAPDQYVLVDDEDLTRLRPKASRTIQITDFVDYDQIDPMYYEHPYFVLPNEGGTHGYQLLLTAMKKQNKVAIGRFVMRGKGYLAALCPRGRVLTLETMRYNDEVVKPEKEFDVPVDVKSNPKEAEVAQRLIEALVTKFEPQKYKDDFREQVLQMIKRKAQGKEIALAPAEEEEAPAVNLMEALQRSLQEARHESTPRRPGGASAHRRKRGERDTHHPGNGRPGKPGGPRRRQAAS